MNESEFMGLLIGAIVVLIGLLTAVITPIIKLNTTLTKLEQTIKSINDDKAVQTKRITEHGKEIDKINEETIKQGMIIDNHENRISTLESLHKRKGTE